MKGPSGKVMTDTSEILESWCIYCDNIYKEENILPSDISPVSVEMEPVPLRSEVATALKSISAGKALGQTKSPSSFSNRAGKKMIDILHRLVVTVWRIGIWPADWCESICVPILK